MSQSAEHFGKFLKACVYSRGISRGKFCALAGISRSSLPYQFDRAEVIMKGRTLDGVLRALNDLRPMTEAEKKAWKAMTATALKEHATAQAADQEREAEALLATLLARHGPAKTARALRGVAMMLGEVDARS